MAITDGTCDAGRMAVEATQSVLSSTWRGDAGGAADTFQRSIEEWKAGLSTVQSAIKDLGEAMGQKQRITQLVESDNSSLASWT